MSLFEDYLQKVGEYGVIEETRHPVVVVSGLPSVKPNEMVVFENGQLGEVFLIDRQSVAILSFSRDPLKSGIKVTRTDQFMTVPVGESLLGVTINPLGYPLTNNPNFVYPSESRNIDSPPLGISQRSRIKSPFLTGVALVDMMIPLGKGQKELIIGDRKMGKSAFLLHVIKNQVALGTIVVFAAIAQKRSDIKKVEHYLETEKIRQNCIIVASTSDDSPSLISLTPFSAMTIAEYFRDQGKNVMVIFDDLSTHARFYRELALQAKRFPGRESYPGDIFYLHARLLERAGNFKHPKVGEVSVTVLPVVELVEGDFTGYIPTNLMSMTDGHIFFDSNIYFQGRRPAINLGLSVTRVGRQVQSDLLKNINNVLVNFLSQYEKVQNLSHFGSELNETTRNTLKFGKLLYEFFEQRTNTLVPLEVQLIVFGMLWSNLLDGKTYSLEQLRSSLTSCYQLADNKAVINQILNVSDMDQLIANIKAQEGMLLNLCKIKI